MCRHIIYLQIQSVFIINIVQICVNMTIFVISTILSLTKTGSITYVLH